MTTRAGTTSLAGSGRRPRLGALSVCWRIGLVLLLFLTFFPFIFMVMSSFKDVFQFYHSFWTPTWPPQFGNYSEAFIETKGYVWNSLVVTAVSIVGILSFSVATGFVFARYEFPGREVLYYGFIVMMMVPGVLMLVPAFVWVKNLELLDSYWVMILPYVAGGQILGIFLLRTFFSQIDRGLYEAAEVDGAGPLRQLWHIALPLSKPVLGTIAIVSALAVWNNFLWPLVTTRSDDVMVLTVGVMRYNTRSAGDYGKMFAGYTLSAIPLAILFLLCTRAFMKGITSGALKG